MGKKTKSKPANWDMYWYISHQGRTERYESQEAALVAVDLIIPSYENGIWDRDDYHILINYHGEETVDDELFVLHHLANVLTPGIMPQTFRVGIYAKNKEDWIFKYGSDLLQQALRAGYDCNEGYLAERLASDYPGFTAKEWSKYKKVDTPNEVCLHACSGYEHSYCSIDRENYYITIDNYLGKYQLVKLIDPNLKITRVKPQIEFTEISDPLMELNATLKRLSDKYADPCVEVTDRKQEWILEHGSDLLQQSLMAGYDCGDRYLQERIAYDYPGFEINERNYPKVNSPDERCLYACLGYEDAYCSFNGAGYYITIDNFLGKHQLIKPIDDPAKVAEENSIVPTVANTFVTQMRRYGDSINSSPIALVVVGTSAYILMMGVVCFGAYLLLS
jgi:hypothetical protein